jgi:1-acyl-sn-glycerol-3-phosphate acyltransferase
MEQSTTTLDIYSDQEVQAAIRELFGFEALTDGMKAFLPPALFEQLLHEKDHVANVFDFQTKIILPILRLIERNSITALSTSGLEALDPRQRYLFVSNHRDIILDSAYLNAVLHGQGFPTGQIAIGDNLMRHRISELIFRINKSFVVKRTGSPIELYRYSVMLSQYVRDTVTSGRDSVWIAQREGRAKDGNDRTQTGLLKMLSLSAASNDLKAHFKSLQVVPVSISYEYDPCDLLKTVEYLKKQADPQHKKTFEEDVASMLLGLKGQKGHVHFHFSPPLTTELDALDEEPNPKKQLDVLAGLIDQRIHQHYALHPVNHVACDLLSGSTPLHPKGYSMEERSELESYFEKKLQAIPEQDRALGRSYLLKMYANPLINYLGGSEG